MNSFWKEAKEIIINAKDEHKSKLLVELDNKIQTNHEIDYQCSLKNECTPHIAGFCCKKHLNKNRFKHEECHCKDNFSIGLRTTDKKTQGLRYNAQHIKPKDTGGLQWPTSNLVQLTGHMLHAFETMLKEESLLRKFY